MSASDHHAVHHPQARPVLLLASASPRRRELLWQIGVPHLIAAAAIDEQQLAGEAPADCVRRLALAKAQKLCKGELPVLGADTAVVVDGAMLGKPASRDAALDMLSRLSGRVHEVLTAVALVDARGSELRLSRSEVRFRELDRAECARYWESGEGRDKAGGYAIQGFGAVFISELRGSYSGVMGLPLFETAALLDAAGVPRWHRGTAGAPVANSPARNPLGTEAL
jgi:septum formation protein